MDFKSKFESSYEIVSAGKTYTGISIQWPITKNILSGEKTIETRTYPLSHKHVNTEMVMVETNLPAEEKAKISASSRMVAIIVFGESFLYPNKKAFYRDVHRHHVTPDSPWAWDDKPKWGWPIKELHVFKTPIPMPKPACQIYTSNLVVPTNIKFS